MGFDLTGLRGTIGHEEMEGFRNVNRPYATFGDGDTTPDVRGWNWFFASNTSPTTITAFLGASEGQEITIIATNGNTTIQDVSSGSAIRLVDGADKALGANEMLVLRFDGSNWYELATATSPDTNTQVGPEYAPATGRWFFPSRVEAGVSASTVNLTTDRLYYVPFSLDRDVTLTDLGFNVTSAAGTKARMGIYSSSGGEPDSLLVETADMDPSTTGDKTAAASLALTAGVQYWIALVADGAAQVRAMAAADIKGLGATGPDAASLQNTHVFEALSGSWTALPSTAGTVSYSTSTSPAPAGKV